MGLSSLALRRCAIGLMCLAAALSESAVAQQVVRIGVIATFSGPLGVIGSEVQRSVDLARDIVGKNVEFVIRDDQGRPDAAVLAVREMVFRDNVRGVIGPIFAAGQSAVAQARCGHATPVGSLSAGPLSTETR